MSEQLPKQCLMDGSDCGHNSCPPVPCPEHYNCGVCSDYNEWYIKEVRAEAYKRGFRDGRKVPTCPRCGSQKLRCPNGHTWEI